LISDILFSTDRYKFIDFDTAVKINQGYCGGKYSSAYIPPEMIYISNRIVMVKGVDDEDAEQGYHPYHNIIAQPSYDIWSLGVVFYELFSGSKLFLAVKCLLSILEPAYLFSSCMAGSIGQCGQRKSARIGTVLGELQAQDDVENCGWSSEESGIEDADK
jgi:serine/threonine protein kinase